MIERDNLISIYKSYHKELFYYIVKFTRQEQTAEDILQDTFLKFIDYITSHEVNVNKIRSFLYATAHNLCVNYIKRAKKIVFTELNDDTNIFAKKDEQFDSVALNELNSKIYAILEHSNPELKSIFIMNKELKMSYEDIAGNLNISERTVRRKIHKITCDILDCLRKEGYIK